MGCKVCKQEDLTNEMRLDPSHPNVVLPLAGSKPKENPLTDLHSQLRELGFTEYIFNKETEHEVTYDRLTQKWAKRDRKTILQRGILNPINVDKLKLANQYLKELHANAQPDSTIQIDEAMTFQCAIQEGQPFPRLNLTILREDTREPVVFEQMQIGIIRSWNLGEQMLNFERIVEFLQTVQQQSPSANVKLVGICRGTKDQQASYEASINSNNWSQYQHIFLDQDEPDDEGWILDVDYDGQKGEVERQNIMSTVLIIDGLVVWKKYDNEWSFASDAEEVEQDLSIYIKDPSKAYKAKNQKIVKRQEISPENYKLLKQVLATLSDTQHSPFSRNLKLGLYKSVQYQNGQKQTVVIKAPQISIGKAQSAIEASSPKTQEQTAALTVLIQQYTPVQNLLWDKNRLIQKIGAVAKENNIDVTVCLEVTIRVKCLNSAISIERKPWEETPFVPKYQSTKDIGQIKPWILARDKILPKLQDELKQQKDLIETTILQKVFDFFRAIPGVQTPLHSLYGPIKYCEQRAPPYEDMLVSKSLGGDITRRNNSYLLVYLIDYENEDSVKLLKDLIALKRSNPTYMKELQFVALGHIRAESWTKLFQAFVEKININQDIMEGILETWFPLEDKISSLSFLAIMGKVYGLQLERKDVLIVDKSNNIIQIESSRRVVTGLANMLQQSKPASKAGRYYRKHYQTSQQQWNQFKQWAREIDVNEANRRQDWGLQQEPDRVDVLCEQRVLKVWTFTNGNLNYTQTIEEPQFNEKLRLPREVQNLKNSLLQ